MAKKKSVVISSMGVDVSTRTAGISLIDEDGVLCYYEAIDLSKQKSLMQKAEVFRTKMHELYVRYDVKNIFVEEPKKAFKAGASSAEVISKLSQFNGICRWIMYTMWTVEPVLVSESTARKHYGVTIKRGLKAKPQVMEVVLQKETLFEVERTRLNNIKESYFDIADSLVVARYGQFLLGKKNQP